MKQFIYIFLLLVSARCAIAENHQQRIDSLNRCLDTDLKDSVRASILREIGVSYVDLGDYPKAIEYFLNSKKIFERITNEYGIFRCQNSLGLAYCFMGDYQASLDYLTNAKTGIEDGLLYDNFGLLYFNKQDYPKSLSYFKQALEFYEAKHDTALITRLVNDVGSLYELLGKSDTAIIFYNKSLQMAEIIQDKTSFANALASLGDIFFKQQKYKQALDYEFRSLNISKEIGDLIAVRETEKILSEIYWAMNDCKSSLMHYQNYILIKDSLVNEHNIRQLVRVEEAHKFEKEKELAKAAQDKKDLLAAQQKNRQRIIIYSISVGLMLILLFSIILYRAFKGKQKQNIIISAQKKVVDEQNKDILDSIRYASRIQQAILPPDYLLKEILPEHFIYFEPKDIVSGDFYIVEQGNGRTFWASCDATGHGSSGALLSMLGSNILTGIIKDGTMTPSMILDKLNCKINESLHKTGDHSIRDGMDVTLCCLDRVTMTLQFSGANNPLWLIRSGEIIEYKADKMPIGQMYKEACYTNHEIKLQPNDCLYSFSDGICDLHSEQNKKFMKKRFRELLLSIQDKSMEEQKNIIYETLKEWKGEADQTDDMLIIGIKI